MQSKKIIILDAGHGNNTPGKRSPVWPDGTQLREYEFNRDIVLRLQKLLHAEGIKYETLVPEVYDIPLRVRVERANQIHKDHNRKTVLFSIHANAGGGTGFEVFTSVGQTKSDDLATILFEEMQKAFPEAKMRADYSDGDPDKESQFYILKNTKSPAILSENFFMDTEDDCRLIMSEEGRQRIALAHFEAIKRICT